MTPDKRMEELVKATEKRINDRIYTDEGDLRTIKQMKAVEREEWITTLTQHHQDLMSEERERAVQIIKDELKNAPLEVQMTKGIIFANIINKISK